MTLVLESVFWSSAVLLVYVYAGYPLLVWSIGRMRRRDVRKAAHEPTVSILIAAFNERAHIAQTIENKLLLDYPADKLQIIVVSDGSSDGTDEIARRYTSDRVVVVRQEPQNGKTAALNLGVTHATGEILVFCDANSLYQAAALRHLVSVFADPTVGYVTGRLAYVNADGSMTGDGCSLYMRYENFIRLAETRVGSIVGVNGGIDAVRRSLYSPMAPDQLPDLVLPLRVIEQRHRVVFEPAAVLNEQTLGHSSDEYRMRVRVSLRAFWALAEMPSLLNPLRFGLFAIQLWSHKALRYLAFALMLALYASAIMLSFGSLFYATAFAVQTLFFAAAWLGLIAERRGRSVRVLYVPYYFTLINVAASIAFWRFLKGERHRMWKPRLG